jgi:peptidoglycan hydrolase-like protein with peptidoglycan-binding domain
VNLDISGIIAPLKKPPALAGALFVALSVGIIANALFLQPRPHPAPLITTRAEPMRGDSRGDGLVLAVQTELAELGYYAGPLDGAVGARTSAAVSAFQAAAGIDQTPAVTYELLSAIRSKKRGQTGSSATPPAEVVKPDSRIVSVQTALARSAYGPVTADGVFGPETRDAIIRFQRDHGLALTGTVNDALIVELRSAGALDAE